MVESVGQVAGFTTNRCRLALFSLVQITVELGSLLKVFQGCVPLEGAALSSLLPQESSLVLAPGLLPLGADSYPAVKGHGQK